MPLPLETVVKQLTDSGIIAPGKLENFVPPKAHPRTVDELVAELVKQNQLTPFQAAQVKLGRARALILGAYTIVDRIGAGGMGQVFKARHRRMDRVVAIKMLPNAMTKDAAAAARFEREVRAAAKLLHPNIVSAFDADHANGVHFLVMEHIEGKDLSALVKQNGPFPVGKAVNYILQAARGLEFAHAEGVVHRDIKPANLLLDKKGVVKILDMGLARIESGGGAPAQAELTGTGAVMGTVDYMAPEQALNTKHADQRADIYSLGISLYYLIAGQAAYSGETLMEKLLAHREQPIPSLRSVEATVPEQLEAVFRKMVAKRIEDRYQSMTEVIEALEGVGIGGSATARKGDVASTVELSSEDRKKLATQGKKNALSSLTGVVASENTKHVFAKIAGGTFATIIAPILVTYLIKHLEKKDEPHNPPAASGATSTLLPPGEGGRRPDEGARPWNTPAFQQWVTATQALPAEQQIEAVSKKLMELNPGFDGKVAGLDAKGPPKIENGIVTQFNFATDNVTDISPLRALGGLKKLSCSGSGWGRGRLSDLSPLQGMPLTHLGCNCTRISDLSPLQGMPLTNLSCDWTPISDLSPLKEMELVDFGFELKNITKGMDVLRRMKSLKTLKGLSAEEFWRKYDAGEFAKPAVAAQPWNTPAFHAWIKKVQAMPAEQQVEAVSKKLMELNPGFDGRVKPKIENGVVTELEFLSNNVIDISPVRALERLRVLSCNATSAIGRGHSALSDISPLRGMPLVRMRCDNTDVSDLSPLRGMALTDLNCVGTKISDLSPLAGMKLERFWCNNTNVLDLTPLSGMPLTDIGIPTTRITLGMEAIRQMRNLTIIRSDMDFRNNLPPAAFWKKYDAGEFGKPAAPSPQPSPIRGEGGKPKLAYLDPAFQQWVAATQALPAEQQIEAVSKKLMELNPGFDGKLTGADGKGTPQIENGVVTQLGFSTINVADVSPVRALPGLKFLRCAGPHDIAQGILSDLSPLQGMALLDLYCPNTQVHDLSPLQGMKLTSLSCMNTQVSDLAPLQGMPLGLLRCPGTLVSDLSPLRGLPLSNLEIDHTKISDLSPLEGMQLDSLNIGSTAVPDLTPLRGMRLKYLNCRFTRVSDLSPLKGMDLTEIWFTPQNIINGLHMIRQMQSLKRIGTERIYPDSTEFWKKYDAGEFARPTGAPQSSKP